MDVLVVGGENSFVQQKFAPNLARHGINMIDHWDWYRRKSAVSIPASAQGVIVIHGMIGHSLSNGVKKSAKNRRIPFLLVPHKFSEALPILQKAGITTTPPQWEEVFEEAEETTETPVLGHDNGEDMQEDLQIEEGAKLVLESHFGLPDTEVADLTRNLVGEAALDTSEILDIVAKTRSLMKTSWSNEVTPTLVECASNWLRTERSLNKEALDLLRQGPEIFGTKIPETAFYANGFAEWEVRNKARLTRPKVLARFEEGRQLWETFTAPEKEQVRQWLQAPVLVSDRTKPCSNFPQGKPIEFVSMLLLATEGQVTLTKTRKAYVLVCKSELGPFYFEAAYWAYNQQQAAMPAKVEAEPILKIEAPVKAEPILKIEAPVKADSSVERAIQALANNDESELATLVAWIRKEAQLRQKRTKIESIRAEANKLMQLAAQLEQEL